MANPCSADLILRFSKADGDYSLQCEEAAAALSSEEILALNREYHEGKLSLGAPLCDVNSWSGRLFDAVFRHALLDKLLKAHKTAASKTEVLRIHLDFEGTPELDELPWELLTHFDSTRKLSVIRHVQSSALSIKTTESHFSILVVMSSPSDLPQFDCDREWELLQDAMKDLTGTGRVLIRRLDRTDESSLRRALVQGQHVFHFVGYGRSNSKANYGNIVLEDSRGASRSVTADYLATICEQYPGIRLAVLSPGGMSEEPNPFAEVARTLVRKGLGSVVALRRRLTTSAQTQFYLRLYSLMSSGVDVDQSVLIARSELTGLAGNVEWDSPMLYSSAENLAKSTYSSSQPGTSRDLEKASSPPPTHQQQTKRPDHLGLLKGTSGSPPSLRREALVKREGYSHETKILILSASPENLARLRLDEELREIDSGLRRAKHRDLFQIEHRPALRPLDLQQAMLDVEPHIVHFCGHGGGEEGLILEDSRGYARAVSASALAKLFGLFSDKVDCVVLNSCHSEHQAAEIAKYIRFVVGMRKEIEDRTAISFAIGFYCALGAGYSIEFAFQAGCSAIELESLPDHLTPVLLKQ